MNSKMSSEKWRPFYLGFNVYRYLGHPVKHFRIDFWYDSWCIFVQNSLKFDPRVPANNKPSLVTIMIWRRINDKPLLEPMKAYFTDAYIRHSASVSLIVCGGEEISMTSIYQVLTLLAKRNLTVRTYGCRVPHVTQKLDSNQDNAVVSRYV